MRAYKKDLRKEISEKIKKNYLNPNLTQKEKNLIDKAELSEDFEQVGKDFDCLGLKY